MLVFQIPVLYPFLQGSAVPNEVEDGEEERPWNVTT